MNFESADLEATYAALSDALDCIEPGQESKFLAKLSLMLALRLADHKALLDDIALCQRDL